MNGTDVIQRAFELAPACGSVEELKRKLVREGYFQVGAHLTGRVIRSQLAPLLNRDLKHSVPKRARL